MVETKFTVSPATMLFPLREYSMTLLSPTKMPLPVCTNSHLLLAPRTFFCTLYRLPFSTLLLELPKV